MISSLYGEMRGANGTFMTVVTCPSCGSEVPAGFKFCGECGAKLAAPAIGAPAPAVAQRGTRSVSSTAKRDEFRDVTVLFADVTGFTALSELLDPEALHSLMNECFDGLGRIVQAHGGHIDKYIGDSIMALFGAPTAHEDDPQRAGEAALAMQSFLSSFRGPSGIKGAGSFRMRIGINSGLVLAGSIGTEGKRDYSVMGDAVNTASRLEGQAAPGSILVSDAFKRRVERQFIFSGPRTISLKGKDKPVAAYELVKEAGDGATDALTDGRRFFGRAAEISQIAGHLAQSSGRGRPLWLDIRGPLGIGKTHLVNEALRHVPDLVALHIVARPATRMRPFALARRTLHALAAHISGTRSAPQTREDFVSALRPIDQDLTPYISALWYLAAPDALALKAPDPDPLTFRRTVERGLERLLSNAAEHEPKLVIVLDAFDLADAETRRFFEAVYRAGLRALPPVIATARSSEAPARQSSETITLAPLARSDAEALALHAAGTAVDAATIDDIVTRAQGVPLFVLELVRSVQEDEALAAEGGGKSSSLSSLPSSLLGVMSSRLDRLDGAQRDVLAQCAVQGVEFSADVALIVWSARGGAPEALAAHLKDLEDRAFIEAPDRNTRRYAFTQALMQNACYDSMLKRDRRALHRDVAAALVVQSGGAQGVSPEQLAIHYELSEQWLEAAIQNLRAGHRAADLYANADAITRYERALRALSELGGKGDGERRIAFETHAGAAQVHLRIGSYADVERDARAMLSHAIEARERAEAMRLLAQGRLHRGDLGSAGELLRDAEICLEGTPQFDDSAPSEPQSPVPGVACHVLYDLADLCFRRGLNDESRRYITRCRALVPHACPELFRLDILEGRVAHTEGRFQDAVDLYQRAHHAAAGSGSLSEEALTSNYMGNAARDVGQYEDAEQYFTRALDIWTRVGLTESMAGAHNNLANLAISRGDAQQAQQHYGLALQAFEQISNAAGTALARTNLAILAIEQGRAEDGIANAVAAQTLLQTSGHRMLLGLASVIHGEALLAAGRAEAASGQFAWIRSSYDENNHPLAVAGALRGEGRVALAGTHPHLAIAPLEAALALYERLARQQEAGRTEVFLARARALCGHLDLARALLESARLRFERIGARSDRVRAESDLKNLETG